MSVYDETNHVKLQLMLVYAQKHNLVPFAHKHMIAGSAGCEWSEPDIGAGLSMHTLVLAETPKSPSIYTSTAALLTDLEGV